MSHEQNAQSQEQATRTAIDKFNEAFNRRVDEGNSRMAWGVPQVSSWYKSASGRVSQNWPFALVDYWEMTRAPNPADFAFLASATDVAGDGPQV